MTMFRRCAVLLLGLTVLGAPIRAAQATAQDFSDYNGCVRLTQKNPNKALTEATEWQAGGGGGPATHCLALAMIALRRYGDAAVRLDKLGAAKDISDFRERAALYDQAGNAWLLARQPRKAIASFSSALALTPNDVDMHAGRARARALAADWYGAEADLTTAIQMDQDRADLLSLRASARRALGHRAEAAGDILRALTIYPGYPAALVERGSMKYEAGDRNGARKDWQKAAKGRGEAADSARRLLKDMGPDPKPLIVQ